MLTMIRPALAAATPTLARIGINAWGYATASVGFVLVSTSIYVVGRKTTNLLDAGLTQVTGKIHTVAAKLEERLADDVVAPSTKATRRAEAAVMRKVEQEIARRISLGELRPASPETVLAE